MASNGRTVPVPFRMRVMKKIVRLFFFLFCLGLDPLLTSTLESSPLVTIAAEELTETGRFDVVCGAEEFPCNKSICLHRSLHCDGIKHCDGNEDEEGCATKTQESYHDPRGFSTTCDTMKLLGDTKQRFY